MRLVLLAVLGIGFASLGGCRFEDDVSQRTEPKPPKAEAKAAKPAETKKD